MVKRRNDKRKNIYQQNTTQKTKKKPKERATQTPLKSKSLLQHKRSVINGQAIYKMGE
jgi:outer membrane lipoprotein-sorting protein